MTDSASSIASGSYAANRKVWQKNVQDVAHQTTATATTIGWLQTNVNRLNVIGKLDKNEAQQVYSFKSLDSGKVTVLQTGDTGVRMQILSQGGRVIADSKANMGVASTNFTAMQQGTFNMAAGQYYVKITRDIGTPPSQPVQYVVQAKMGTTFTNDYITQEKPAKPTYTQPVASPVASVLINQMMGSNSLISGNTDVFGAIESGFPPIGS